MKNVIKQSIAGLLTQAERSAAGATQYGDTIGLEHNPGSDIRTDITALLDERDGYDGARVTLRNLQATRETAIEDSKAFLALARELLRVPLGKTWSQTWNPTGFTSSLTIPQKAGEIQPLVQSVGRYLASNPELQKADVNVTAARAVVLFDALVNSQGGIDAQKTHTQNLFAGRNAKVAQLRKRLSGLLSELKQLLPPLDNRWLAFGFNKPGASATPETPLNVTAVLIGPNAVSVQWEHSIYATYYRVWAKVVGVDQELINIGDATDINFTMQGVPAGAQVQIAVSAAVTGGGESAKSEIVTITLPA